MWSEQPFEQLLKNRLESLPTPYGTDLHTDYGAARRFVTEEIAPYISKVETELTDHSEGHLAHVMSRAVALLGNQPEYFTPHELYLLAVSILVHDTGNLHGRKEHQQKIASVYEGMRKREPRFATERNAVLVIAGAHTGTAKNGSKDTLQELGPLTFLGNSIRGQELAAVLRLSDELAEGPQRTSAYLLNHGLFQPDSRIFHKYALISDYCVDRGEGRIALTYNIDVEVTPERLEIGNGIALEDMLRFCYKRIHKVDQERRYCKYYCNLLTAFKETGAWFNFYFGGQKLELAMPPIVISDLIVPGEATKDVEQIDPRYNIVEVVKALDELCRGKHDRL